MISIIKLKKYIAGANIFSTLVIKLCLVILFKVDKGLEISFYYTILLLFLAVRLKVEGDEEFLFNS